MNKSVSDSSNVFCLLKMSNNLPNQPNQPNQLNPNSNSTNLTNNTNTRCMNCWSISCVDYAELSSVQWVDNCCECSNSYNRPTNMSKNGGFF